MKKSLCESCGACCAFFRVSFPCTETEDTHFFPVPAAMTLVQNLAQRFMIGTQTRTPRCIALEGSVGYKVRCTIYENRPSTCRNFILSWENNTGNLLCDQARASFGLQPFSQY
ncbi:MAG: YkgJ family cysteine cluster protein [Pseudomonadota bacterium]